MDIAQLTEWWNVHGVAVVTAVIAVTFAAEGLCRVLESACLGLLKLASATKTTKDDEALKGAAKWFHGAALAISKVTALIRPFSVKGR